jgi:tetratricopeptide (TPR) repeat protein
VALKLSEQYGEVPLLFPVLRSLSSFYMYRAEFDKGLKVGERILELAEREDDDFLRVHAYLVIGANTGFMISYEQGLEILEKGTALFEKEMGSFRPFQLGNNPGIVCYTSSAFFLYWLGYLDRGLEKANRAIELAGQLQHPFTLAYALFHTGSLHLWRGEMETVSERAHTMLELAEEHGFQIWVSLARMLQGSAQMVLGEPEAGLDNIERGFAIYQGLKSPPLFYPQLIAMRAAALGQAGRAAEGLQLVEALLNEVGEEQALKNLPPLILLKGDLLLAVSPENRAQAAEIYWMMLSNPVGLGGKIFKLQTATRLCRLEMMEGDASRSGKLLAEIYDSFSEGFDTADLQVAKAILEQWRG